MVTIKTLFICVILAMVFNSIITLVYLSLTKILNTKSGYYTNNVSLILISCVPVINIIISITIALILLSLEEKK